MSPAHEVFLSLLDLRGPTFTHTISILLWITPTHAQFFGSVNQITQLMTGSLSLDHINISWHGWSIQSSPVGSQELLFKSKIVGTSLAVQWLSLRTSTAGGTGSIPSWGTKIPRVVQCGQKKKKSKIVISTGSSHYSKFLRVCAVILTMGLSEAPYIANIFPFIPGYHQ